MMKQNEIHEGTEKLLLKLADICIENNYYRTDEKWKGMCFLDEQFIRELCDDEKCPYDGGYMYLNKDGSTNGLIRMYYGLNKCSTWSFWKKNGKIEYDMFSD